MQQQISTKMTLSTVIGREEELATISRLYESERSEFLAIYGRRRVGKSFLVEESFLLQIPQNSVILQPEKHIRIWSL